MKSFIPTALCLLALAACDKPSSTETKTDDQASKTAATTNAASTPTSTAQPAAVSINEADLATPADFEEVAEKAISAKTYKAELATLEADIAKE